MLILLNKPFGVLCQFTDEAGRPTLSRYVAVPGVYPAGRLDHDSEGLVLLTDDGALQARLADPRHRVEKVYWAQVEGEPVAAAFERLQRGVVLKDGRTRPARVRRIEEPPGLWPASRRFDGARRSRPRGSRSRSPRDATGRCGE